MFRSAPWSIAPPLTSTKIDLVRQVGDLIHRLRATVDLDPRDQETLDTLDVELTALEADYAELAENLTADRIQATLRRRRLAREDEARAPCNHYTSEDSSRV